MQVKIKAKQFTFFNCITKIKLVTFYVYFYIMKTMSAIFLGEILLNWATFCSNHWIPLDATRNYSANEKVKIILA